MTDDERQDGKAENPYVTDPGQRTVRGHPVTPDGRYFVVRGRLWRMSDPALPPAEREKLVGELMAARRAVGAARQGGNPQAEALARHGVDIAKHALGERGPVWWDDHTPDYNRHMVAGTPYAAWFDALEFERP